MTSPAVNPLDEEIGRLKEFVSLLQREQDLLKKGDTEALLPLIDTKTQLADRLAALARAREAHLARQGFPAGRPGMEDWLQRHGNAAQRQSWQALLELAREARDLNELNGRLIGLHMQHNQQAFTALMNATNRAMTYGPDGQQQAGLGGRILGTA
ncbi:MAG: flagellar protein FlgN [Rhodocyclaceae bacterium]|nr:flagellar protein FlgN [Rhodocyclaceae bacterium]